MSLRNIIILIALISCFESSLASEIDISKWSYDDLSQTACEMAGDKNYRGALKIFDLAVHADPNNPEGYINRGAMLGVLHQKEKAIQDEQKALSMAVTNSKDDIDFRCSAHKNLSGIYLNYKEFDKAEKEARLAVNLGFSDPFAQERLGDILKINSNLSESLYRLKKAQALYDRAGLPKEAAKIDAKILELKSK